MYDWINFFEIFHFFRFSKNLAKVFKFNTEEILQRQYHILSCKLKTWFDLKPKLSIPYHYIVIIITIII